MPKIIAVSEKIVSIGLDSGKLRDVATSDCNFNPRIGDEVEIFESDGKVIVSKKDTGLAQPHINNKTEKTPWNDMDPEFIDGKIVNKLAYALFAIFLGDLGIHKFYAGKIGMGILYLLFCWTLIPGLIGFIEGIIALTKQEDSDGNIVV